MAKFCSLRFWSTAIVVVAAAIGAFMPMLMSSLLRHMFTAPGQNLWPHGSLRLIDCNGVPSQALNSAERISELEDGFIHKDGDVWIVSFVKSGTTWTIGILAALYEDSAAQYSGNMQKMTRTFCPQPELPDLGWKDDGFGHSMEELNSWPSKRRCFKSHWPSQDFVLPNGKSKFIYVMRNAQDQMISHWNQVWGMGFHYDTADIAFEDGWGAFVQDWLDGNVEGGSWFDHVASWYSRSKTADSDVLLVRYEDLKTNLDETIHRISKFVNNNNNPMNDELMARVKDLTSFERMKEADDKDIGLKFMRWLGVLRKKHIRQGEIGGGDLKLSEKQKMILEQEYESKLKPLGMPREWVLLDE
mmetsp:Transcript_26388/g.57834  ORF Transcript_26388/g.57834 Transcript_26388/m.57834 type:complete len:358 (-) Transcript_26388:359-1432(-)|eukprot:CAMPEP_0168180028 /NCGR_PEP_ID=MMETSP0139_2-20121125/10236_1 /TAXON_ID=44445 /ORGANISM="Pseudo-nitzschia australis, Strain 10249 10 AB" /LENGTH=357 /DNA_ID=CAMNT_0008100053 /DNA_START=94 /DNA_END=1167 /DNA_ORIENTATION=-